MLWGLKLPSLLVQFIAYMLILIECQTRKEVFCILTSKRLVQSIWQLKPPFRLSSTPAIILCHPSSIYRSPHRSSYLHILLLYSVETLTPGLQSLPHLSIQSTHLTLRRRIRQYTLRFQPPPRFLKRPCLYPTQTHTYKLASSHPIPNQPPSATPHPSTNTLKHKQTHNHHQYPQGEVHLRSIRLISISHHPKQQRPIHPPHPHPLPSFLFPFLAGRYTPQPAGRGVVMRMCVLGVLGGGGGKRSLGELGVAMDAGEGDGESAGDEGGGGGEATGCCCYCCCAF